MSCYTIYYKDGAKMMRPVLSREEYLRLRDTDDQKNIVYAVRQGKGTMKHRLVQMNYSCLPNEDGSLKGSKLMTTSVGMDVDHIAKEEMQEVKERILAKKEELGLLLLELSARGEGYHLVFKRKAELSQEDNLRWASDLLGVEYDAGAKDITRVFFTTTASPEDLIYLSDELFDNSEPLSVAKRHLPQRGDIMSQPSELTTPSPSGEGWGEGLEKSYDGIPYSFIVEALEDQLGGVPAHGSRNQFIFSMACHLRYICNHDPEWVAQILPTYGEAREKWQKTIKSACNRVQHKNVSSPLLRAIEIARSRMADDETDTKEGYDGSGNGSSPPPMPGKLPKLIELLVSRTPDIYKPAVAHAVFPALATHLWKTRFRYIDNVEHEATLMNVLMAGTGAGKNCISEPIRYIMKDILEIDQINRDKEKAWKDEMQTKGSNKDKKKRPEGLIIQNVKPDMTNAAFVQRMKEAEGHFLYTQMNEIDQFDALKTSARSQSQFQIMCLAFDPGSTYGTERVGTASVSETVNVRFNWNASTTIKKGQQYFSRVLTDGPISRINFCTIPEREIGAEMPIYGTYDSTFSEKLKPYIDRLNAARGLIECDKAYKLAQKLMEENADFARLSQSRTYENLSYRANVIAYLKAMVLYVANGEKWETEMEDFIRWSEQYDLWCKMRFFGDAIETAEEETKRQRRGPKNLLEDLPEKFTLEDAIAVRRKNGKSADKVSGMLASWQYRGYITYDPIEQIWKKQ